ncbi:MAG TPA: M1 family peptidase [Anaerolineae bacterium]|nr:M1 family peptidase [Anaerolineae bacterium]
MQIFQAKVKVIWLAAGLLFLAACGEPAATVEPVTAVPVTTASVEETAVAPIAETEVEIVAGGRSMGDPYAPELGNTGYDAQHYTIQIALDPAVEEFSGTVTIEAEAEVENLGEISLDFIGFEIESLLVDGVPALFSREDGKLVIQLPEPLAAGELFTIEVSYAGPPEERPSRYVPFAESIGMFYGAEETIYVLSEPDGARFWFPNNDHPKDKATYRFEVAVPEGLTAVSNGALLATLEDTPLPDGAPGTTFVWEHNYPMASYLATIAVGEYKRIEGQSPSGIALRDYVFPDDRGAFARSTANVGEAIEWMGDLFGEYPFEEYGYVTVHAPGVSLETQTMVLLSSGMLNEETVIHEMAHMWFGDWVSLDSWGEMWRNEGFATYVTILWENRDDPEEVDLVMEGVRAFLDDEGINQPLLNPPPRRLFSTNSYFGGALMIHELRQEVGDEAFFAGLKAYFAEYGGGAASDAQFQEIMEEASGQSLGAFFEKWLVEGG